MLKISGVGLMVDDQAKAHKFYTETLGFQVRHDIPLGEHRWLTVVCPADPDGPEVSLEPDQHPAAKTFKAAMVEDGIPFTSFAVEDIEAEMERMRQEGFRLLNESPKPGADNKLVCFLHPKDTNGVLVEFCQTIRA